MTTTSLFPASQQQLRCWSVQPDPPRSRCVFLVRGRVQPDRLKSALDDLIQKYEVLRTDFPTRGSHVCTVHDTKLNWILEKDNPSAFNTDDASIARAAMISATDDCCSVKLSLPAWCVDERSLELLAVELANAITSDCESPDDEGRNTNDNVLQYGDYSTWQAELLDDDDAHLAAGFWQNHLKPVESTLPFTRRQGTVVAAESMEGVDCELSVPLHQLQAFATRSETTVEAVLFAVWTALLSRLTTHSEVSVGRISDGRGIEELQTAVGPFSRMHPLRIHIDEDGLFSRHLQAVTKQLQDAHELGEYFRSNGNGNADAAGRCEFGFDFRTEAKEVMLSDIAIQLADVAVWTERFLVCLVCRRNSSGIRVQLKYDAGTF